MSADDGTAPGVEEVPEGAPGTKMGSEPDAPHANATAKNTPPYGKIPGNEGKSEQGKTRASTPKTLRERVNRFLAKRKG